MYALILIVYIQMYTSAFPEINRLDIDPQRKETLAKCRAAGNILIGPLFAETDPSRQFAWRDFECVKLKS